MNFITRTTSPPFSLTVILYKIASCLLVDSLRVSNELGKGNAKAAKFSIKVVLSTSICTGVVIWIPCLVFGSDVSYLFSNNKEVAKTVSSLSNLLAFSLLVNSVHTVFTCKYFL